MKLITEKEAEVLAELQARHAKERSLLGTEQENARRTMLDRQARELATLGVQVDQAGQLADVHQVAGNTDAAAPTTSTRRVLSPPGAAARRPR